MNGTDKPDDLKFVATVSIPDGMTVEEVNAAGAKASAEREEQRAKASN